MALTEAERDLVRDEVGAAPGDDELDELSDGLIATGVTSWIAVALRVLKRRRAEATAESGGSVSSVSIPGAISVGLRGGSVTALDRQIERLEAALRSARRGHTTATDGGHLTRRGIARPLAR